jgi:hypothetical protein
MTSTTPRRIVGLFALATLIGLGIFGVLVWRAVTVEDVERTEAMHRIELVRAGFQSHTPLIELDQQGRMVRAASPGHASAAPIMRLKALAWRAPEHRLVSTDAPFWFFKVKGPAARYALEGTGFDLQRLHLTPADIERAGPALLLDHTSSDGSRLLVWTE